MSLVLFEDETDEDYFNKTKPDFAAGFRNQILSVLRFYYSGLHEPAALTNQISR